MQCFMAITRTLKPNFNVHFPVDYNGLIVPANGIGLTTLTFQQQKM